MASAKLPDLQGRTGPLLVAGMVIRRAGFFSMTCGINHSVYYHYDYQAFMGIGGAVAPWKRDIAHEGRSQGLGGGRDLGARCCGSLAKSVAAS